MKASHGNSLMNCFQFYNQLCNRPCKAIFLNAAKMVKEYCCTMKYYNLVIFCQVKMWTLMQLIFVYKSYKSNPWLLGYCVK